MKLNKVCLPKAAGGLNIADILIWNRAAVMKLFWNLAQKKDVLWVKWVHTYYIKNKDVNTMSIPKQASWVVKKILSTREFRDNIVEHNGKYNIGRVYRRMRDYEEKVEWRKIMCSNNAPPKCTFIMWLAIHGRLLTTDNLRKFGVLDDMRCSLCTEVDESIQHLFFECKVAGRIWNEILRWQGIDRQVKGWNDEFRMLSQAHTNSRTHMMYRMEATVTVYEVWRERNARKFSKKVQEENVIVRNILTIIYGRWLKNKNLNRLDR